MPSSNATKNANLKMHLQGIDPSYRAGATQYVALVSLASPDEAAPIASERPPATSWAIACRMSGAGSGSAIRRRRAGLER